MKVPFHDYLEKSYRTYAQYVIENRAVPHLVDGLKTGQRKLLFVAGSRAKSLMKVNALQGFVAALGNYHHGDMSMSKAIVNMAQDFVGSNNYPIFKKKGAFGNRFEHAAAAPRYIFVEISELYEKLFVPIDMKVAEEHPDPEEPEPRFLLPLIPLALLNGADGIAVGYATSIVPCHPKDIMRFIINYLDGKDDKTVFQPFYKGYNGSYQYDKEENKWYQNGIISKIGKGRLLITEVPIRYDQTGYMKVLNKLLDREIIKDFTDYSKDGWKIEVSTTMDVANLPETELLDLFKLSYKINPNMNFINDTGDICHFDTVQEYLKTFVDIRLSYYSKRKAYILDKLDMEATKLYIRKEINTAVKNSQKKFTRDEIIGHISEVAFSKYMAKEMEKFNTHKTIKFGDVVSEVVSATRILDVTDERITQNQQDLTDKIDERNEIYETDEKTLYKEDLMNLFDYLKKV